MNMADLNIDVEAGWKLRTPNSGNNREKEEIYTFRETHIVLFNAFLFYRLFLLIKLFFFILCFIKSKINFLKDLYL